MKVLPQAAYWKPDGTQRQFSVYIMSNSSMTLYTGVTNDLPSRVNAHKKGTGSQFTSRYRCDRLVYFESFAHVTDAIAREKQIKGLTRTKKIALVKTVNREWRDLDWTLETNPSSPSS